MVKRVKTVLILVVVIACLSCSEQNIDKPNILLIVADDLGFSDLGAYGGEIDTPFLDQLASQGLRFTRFYSTGRCCPSRASILTGLYPHRAGLGHKVEDLGQPGYLGRVSEDAVTVAQVLQDAGYRSFISGKWHLGTDDPTEYGFESFYGTLVSAQTFWDPEHYLKIPANQPRRKYVDGTFYGTTALTDYAMDFLNEARSTPDQPWFLYLAYNAPHFPLQAPKEYIEKYIDRYRSGWDQIREQRLQQLKKLGIVSERTVLSPRSKYWNYGQQQTGVNPAWNELKKSRQEDLIKRMAIYAAMIDVMDQNIGRILSDLGASNEMENTLIMFVSDNGACAEWDPFGFDIKSGPVNVMHQGDSLLQMGSEGTYHSVGSGWANASNTPWRLYKHFNHEGGISTPFIVHWPQGLIGNGVMDHTPGHLIDIMPTILAASDIEYPSHYKNIATAPLAGVSLLPLFQGGSIVDRNLYFEHEGNRAVIQGSWKLSALNDEDWELYNTQNDRTEMNNLVNYHPETVTRLANDWDHWASDNFVTPLPTDYKVKYLKSPNEKVPK